MTRSADGYCRLNKTKEFGCPIDRPLLCPNGFCSRTTAECAGEASCPTLNRPFKCADGSCKNNITACRRPLRTY